MNNNVDISQDEIERLRHLVEGNQAYANLTVRSWTKINDDPNYEIKLLLSFDENNVPKKSIIVRRVGSSISNTLYVIESRGGKKSRKMKNKKSRKRKNKKSRKRKI
jgi:hypothetical protein